MYEIPAICELKYLLITNKLFDRYPEAALDVGRPAAIRAIARARRRASPPIPQTLRDWVDVLSSEEWGPRLRFVTSTTVPFYQGPLEVLQEDGSIQFVGIVFTNIAFIQEINVHMRSVRTICMDGTFQTRPRQPEDIDQLFTIQIIFNNVVSCLNKIYFNLLC